MLQPLWQQLLPQVPYSFYSIAYMNIYHALATAYIAYYSSLSNGCLQVHSNVLTSFVPGYLLG